MHIPQVARASVSLHRATNAAEALLLVIDISIFGLVFLTSAFSRWVLYSMVLFYMKMALRCILFW